MQFLRIMVPSYFWTFSLQQLGIYYYSDLHIMIHVMVLLNSIGTDYLSELKVNNV